MWSYKKPTEPGLYMVNLGDVVTKTNFEVIELNLIHATNELCDRRGIPVNDYNDSYKFMPFDYEALNKIGSE